jgi:hypothetical protein
MSMGRARLLSSTILALGMLAASASTAHANTPDTTVVDGGGNTGIIVSGNTTLAGANSNVVGASDVVGSNSTQTVYTNFATLGGTGSGGGAGLGGVFFVDTGASLTLHNVSFANNTVTGGQGGGVKVDSVAPAAFSITGASTDASALQQFQPGTSLTYAGGDVLVNSFTFAAPSTMFGTGSGIGLPGGTFGTSVASTTLNNDGSETVNLSAPLVLTPGAGVDRVLNTGIGSFAMIDGNSSSNVLPGMAIVGLGIPAGVVVNAVSYDGSGNIASFTAKDASGNAYTLPVGSFAVVNQLSYDFGRLATSVNGATTSNQLVSTGPVSGFAVGMTVSGNGVPGGTTVTAVATTTDPDTGNTVTTVTLSQPVNLLTATNITASFNPLVSNTGQAVLTLQSVTGLVVGQTISGSGIPSGTTITAINGNTITLSNPLGQAGINAISNSHLLATVSPVISSGAGSVRLASVSGYKIGDIISGDPGIPANAQITAIDPVTKTVSYTVNPALASINQGGSMNGLRSGGTVGSPGGNGQTGSSYSASYDNGEGSPGSNGANGGGGSSNAGGNGGNGGSGSDGSSTNKTLIVATTFDIVGLAADFLKTSGDGSPFVFSKFPGDIAGDIADAGHLAFDIAQLVAWSSAEKQGLVALGGAGGAGGNGGAGTDFFGGGVAGNGGSGGQGAESNTIGGAGGVGGNGGTGGFGAGGGDAGAGGKGGTNGVDGAGGIAGAAGFGGGAGSVAGQNGQGGSGFGGALFVRSGGTLTITGNAIYQNNASLAGSSNNGGVAGQSAGGDLFIMSGANVYLQPGSGNTITFYDSIGDDSTASYATASNAAGQGGSIHIGGGGTVQFLGLNTYSGTTYISGATLETQDGAGINIYSHILFDGAGTIGSNLSTSTAGVLLSGGTFARAVGYQPNNVSWSDITGSDKGSGGFAATSGGLTVNLGSINGGVGPTLTWNQGGFVTTGSTLIFGSDATDATGTVTFQNAINLATHTGGIAVYHNAGSTTDGLTTFDATMSGVISGGALAVNDTGYTGSLLLSAHNSLTGLTLNAGTLSTTNGTTVGRLMDATSGGYLTINGGTLILGGAEKLTTVDISSVGALLAQGAITSGVIFNGGVASFNSTLNADGITNVGVLGLKGTTNVAGIIVNVGTLLQGANTSAANVVQIGTWDMAADLTATGTVTNNGTLNVIGSVTGTPAVETAATRTITTAGFAGSGTTNLGGLTGNTADTLVINQSGASAYSGSFTGAGSLTKTGAGNLNLQGANSFTGPLSINGGTIDTTGGGTFADTTDVTVNTAGTYIVGTDDTIHSIQNFGATTINANLSLTTLANGLPDPVLGTVTVNGTLNASGAVSNYLGTMIFSSGSAENLSTTLYNAATLNSQGALGVSGLFTNDTGGTATLGSAGSSTFGSLTNAGTLTASSPLTVTNAVINADGGTMTLNAGSAASFGTLTNSGTIAANDSVTVSGAYVQTAGSLTTGNNANLTTGSFSGAAGAITLNGSSLFTINQTADGTFSGTVSGTGTVYKQGTATLTLAGGTDSFAPSALTVHAGGVTVQNAGVLDGALVAGTDSAGTLTLLADQSIARLLNNGTSNLQADLTTSSIVLNNGTLNVIGTGSPETATTRTINTLAFVGASAGVVNLGGNSGNVANTLVINQSATSVYAGIFTGAGGLTKIGRGTLYLAGANTFTGPLIVNGGTLNTTYGGTLADSLDVTVGTDGIYVVGIDDTIHSVTNNGGTTVNAAVTLATFSNSATGVATVNGSLTASGNVSNAGYMYFDYGSAETISGNLTNTATLISYGTLNVIGQFLNDTGATATLGRAPIINIGQIVLSQQIQSGPSTFGTLLNNGTLDVYSPLTVIGNATNSATGTITLNAGSTPSFGSLNNAGTITDADTMAVTNNANNSGTLTLNGASNSFGSLTNQSTGTITATAAIVSNGAVSNSGAITTVGLGGTTLANNTGGTIANTYLTEFLGAVTNSGAITTVGLAGATLSNNAGGTITNTYLTEVSGAVSNSGAITTVGLSGASLTNSGTISSTGLVNISGAYVQNAGSLSVTQGLSTGSLSGTGGAIHLTNASAFVVNQTTDGSYAGTIDGTGGVLKYGTATLTISGGVNSFSPASLDIYAGQVIVSNAGALNQALNVAVASSGTLTLQAQQTIHDLTGSGTLNLGNNTLTLAEGGNFNGTVNGTGGVQLASGTFTLNNTVDTGGGTIQVQPGSTMDVGSQGSITSGVLNINGGTLDLTSTGTATTTNVTNGGILHLGNGIDVGVSGSQGGLLTTTTLVIDSGGSLTGNGTVTGDVQVGGSSGGTVAPGNSPGILTVGSITFDALSTAAMQIDGAAGAGVAGGNDQIVIHGALTLKPGSTLAISKSTPNAFDLALGQQIQLFRFTPGSVSGAFGTVTATGYTKGMIFNVETGSVIGIGSSTPAQFQAALSTTPNTTALMNALQVGTAGGVSQYYGGNLLGYLTTAQASATPGAVATTFARWSPEGYAGILDQMKQSVLDNLTDESSYDTLTPGRTYATGNMSRNNLDGASVAGYARNTFGDTALNVGFAHQFSMVEVSLSYGHTDGTVQGDYLHGTVLGDQFIAGASVPVALGQKLRVIGRLTYGDYSSHGTRATNSGTADFGGVKSQTLAYGLGLAYHQAGSTQLDLSGEVIGVDEVLHNFTETTGAVAGAGALDLMNLHETNHTAWVGRLDAKLGTELTKNAVGYVDVTYEHELGRQMTPITGNVAVENVNYTVNNPGLARDRVVAGLGAKLNVTPTLQFNLDAKGGTNAAYTFGGGLRLSF